MPNGCSSNICGADDNNGVLRNNISISYEKFLKLASGQLATMNFYVHYSIQHGTGLSPSMTMNIVKLDFRFQVTKFIEENCFCNTRVIFNTSDIHHMERNDPYRVSDEVGKTMNDNKDEDNVDIEHSKDDRKSCVVGIRSKSPDFIHRDLIRQSFQTFTKKNTMNITCIETSKEHTLEPSVVEVASNENIKNIHSTDVFIPYEIVFISPNTSSLSFEIYRVIEGSKSLEISMRLLPSVKKNTNLNMNQNHNTYIPTNTDTDTHSDANNNVETDDIDHHHRSYLSSFSILPKNTSLCMKFVAILSDDSPYRCMVASNEPLHVQEILSGTHHIQAILVPSEYVTTNMTFIHRLFDFISKCVDRKNLKVLSMNHDNGDDNGGNDGDNDEVSSNSMCSQNNNNNRFNYFITTTNGATTTTTTTTTVIYAYGELVVDVEYTPDVRHLQKIQHMISTSIHPILGAESASFQYTNMIIWPTANTHVRTGSELELSSIEYQILGMASSSSTSPLSQELKNVMMDGGDDISADRDSSTSTSTNRYNHSSRVSIYFKELERHGANNRLFLWACYGQHVGLTHLSVITDSTSDSSRTSTTYNTSPDNHHHQQHNSHASKSAQDISSSTSSEVEPPFSSPSLKEDLEVCGARIHSFPVLDMKTAVDTWERLTHLLLIAARLSGKPLVLMDLPNILVPEQWTNSDNRLVHALVAPSRAVALHPLTMKNMLPIAVILPALSSAYTPTTSSSSSSSVSQSQQCNDSSGNSNISPRNGNVFRFLFVGRLAVEKSPGVLIRAFALVLHNLSSIMLLSESDKKTTLFPSPPAVESALTLELVILGDGPLLDALQLLCEVYNISDRVIFRGSQPEDLVGQEMRRCDVLVNPRVDGETFGFVFAEAVANRLPVIAFDRGSAREAVLSGILVEEVSVQALARAMTQYVQDWFTDELPFSQDWLCNQSEKVKIALHRKKHAEDFAELINCIVGLSICCDGLVGLCDLDMRWTLGWVFEKFYLWGSFVAAVMRFKDILKVRVVLLALIVDGRVLGGSTGLGEFIESGALSKDVLKRTATSYNLLNCLPTTNLTNKKRKWTNHSHNLTDLRVMAMRAPNISKVQ
eukprot:gene4293-8533_t